MKTKQVTAQLLIFLTAFIIFAAATANAAPGDLDTTFGGTGKSRAGLGGGIDSGNALAVQSDGKIVVAGSSGRYEGGNAVADFAVARYNTDGSPDNSFDGDGKVITSVGAFTDFATGVRIQTDGKIVVAGYTLITSINYDIAIVRYNSDGSLDASFDGDGIVITNLGGLDRANALLIQGDGKIIVAGTSSGMAAVRYNTNGTLDNSFSGDGIANSLGATAGNAAAIQPDGKIVIVGATCAGSIFTTCSVAAARLNSDGTPDTSFDSDGIVFTSLPSLTESANAVVIQPGDNTINNPDKIVVAGSATSDSFILRYNLNGSLDNSFDGDGILTFSTGTGNDAINAVGFQSSGFNNRIIVAGYAENGSTRDFAVARLLLNGALDTAFDGDGIATTDIGGGVDEGRAMTLGGGKITVAGYANDAVSSDFALVRYNSANGTLDATFDGDGKKNDDIGNLISAARSAAIQTDGKIVVAGGVTSTYDNFAVLRYNNGTLDTTFSADGKTITPTSGRANAVAIQSDGKIVAAGGNTSDFVLVRYNTDGSLDTMFDADGIVTTSINAGGDIAYSIVIQSDGKIVVAGSTSNGSNTDFAIARYNTDGMLDTSFDTDGKLTTPIGAGNNEIKAMTLQTDGKIVVAGFSSNGANTDFAAARYNANGSLDFSFSFDGIVTTSIVSGSDGANAVAIQSGKIVAAGFAYNGANNDFAVARYNADGTPDNSFDTDGNLTTEIGAEDVGSAAAIQFDGKIVVAGSSFTGANTDFAVVRYNADGTLDSSLWNSSDLYGSSGRVTVDFSSGGNDYGYGIALDSFSRAVVVGESNGLFGTVRISGGYAPTAASVAVSGRVLTPSGRGLMNAFVSLTDSFGNTRTARTTAFGYYRFAEVAAGQTCVFSVASKRYQFNPQAVTVMEDIEDLNFVAAPL